MNMVDHTIELTFSYFLFAKLVTDVVIFDVLTLWLATGGAGATAEVEAGSLNEHLTMSRVGIVFEAMLCKSHLSISGSGFPNTPFTKPQPRAIAGLNVLVNLGFIPG